MYISNYIHLCELYDVYQNMHNTYGVLNSLFNFFQDNHVDFRNSRCNRFYGVFIQTAYTIAIGSHRTSL